MENVNIGGIKPREEVVMVGDLYLTLKEVVASKREFVLQKLAQYDIAEELYSGITGGEKLSGMKIISTIQKLIVKFLSSDMADIAAKLLDNDANRGKTKTDKAESFSTWIKDNMTWAQETEFLKALVKVNDFEAILKNYREVGRVMSSLFQSAKPLSDSVTKVE